MATVSNGIRRNCRVLLLSIGTWGPLLFGFKCIAQNIPSIEASSSSPSETERMIEAWIQDLKSTKFEVRQNAFESLFESGESALPQLRKSFESTTDPESLARIQAVIERVVEVDQKKRSREFIQDAGSPNDHGFSTWKTFRELAGNGRMARSLFMDIEQAYPDLTRAASDAPESIQDACIATIEKIAKKEIRELELRDGVAMMYAIAASPKPVDGRVEEWAIRIIRSSPLQSKLADRSWRLPIKRLLSQYYQHIGTHRLVSLMDAQKLDLAEEASPLARNILKEPLSDMRLFMLASQTLVKLGDKKDVSLFESWLENVEEMPSISMRTTLGGFDDRGNEPPIYLVRRIQDVALIGSVILQGQEPKDYMPRFRLNAYGTMDELSIGFPSDAPELRTKAFEKWKTTKPK